MFLKGIQKWYPFGAGELPKRCVSLMFWPFWPPEKEPISGSHFSAGLDFSVRACREILKEMMLWRRCLIFTPPSVLCA